MLTQEQPYVFQADSDLVNNYYQNAKNYLISYNELVEKEYCAVYFSSNAVYYPNTEKAFNDSIVRKNKFDWDSNTVSYAYKHIFLRDLKKQWYLTGLNIQINTPDKLLNFLEEETKGFKTIFIGSSAGGFISVIMGQKLKADKIFTFNGQFEISSLLDVSSGYTINPIVFRYKADSQINIYYDSANYISDPTSIYYFHSNKCKWDIDQLKHLKAIPINIIKFNTDKHGIPFSTAGLQFVLNLNHEELREFTGKTFNPISFSLKTIFFSLKTAEGFKPVIKYGLNKIVQLFRHIIDKKM